MKRIFILVVLLSLIPISAQARRVGDLTATSGAVIDFSDAERFGVPTGTIADMPTAGLESGTFYWTTDSTGVDDCSTGGGTGTYKILCGYNGTSWDALGGTGGGEVQYHLMTPDGTTNLFAAQTDNSQNFIIVGDVQAGNIHDDGSSVFLGANENASLSASTRNTVVGIGSGAAITSGTDNVSIGYQAALANNGANNIAIGDTTLSGNTTGVDNVVIGANAGDGTASSRNVVLGNDAASAGNIGDDNILIGNDSASGGAGSDNIYIGPNAGTGGESKLYIDSGAVANALISGDFSARTLDVDGAFSIEQGQAVSEIATAVAGTSDTVLLTEGAVVAHTASLVGSGLEEVTESTKTGWRLKGQNPLNYGDTGTDAVDLSISTAPSSTRGATGDYATSTGANNTSSGSYSHTEGSSNIASGESSHAEGVETTASGIRAHSEGHYTDAAGDDSHAEGISTTASGEGSHTEGNNTTASGDYGHAEGSGTTAWLAAHAEGLNTTAIGLYSHSEGNGTYARNEGSHAAGKFNVGTSTETIHETGIGTGSGDKRNAFEIYLDGTAVLPDATVAEIEARAAGASGNYVIITKGYLDEHGTAGDHTIASHDTEATGAELDILTDGSNSDSLHVHTATGVTDFDTEVSNNTDVAANIAHVATTSGDNVHGLVPSDIGAQPLDTDLTTLATDVAYQYFHNNASGVMTAYTPGTLGYAWISNGASAEPTWQSTGVGDVIGPSSSVDNQITKFSGTDGKTIQEAQMSEDASGNVAVVGSMSANGYAQVRTTDTPATFQRWYEPYNTGNDYVTVEAPLSQDNTTGKISWPAVDAGVTETVAMLSDVGAGFDTTAVINATWGDGTASHTWTWDTGVGTDPQMAVSDTGHVFNYLVTSNNFVSTDTSGGINKLYPTQTGTPDTSTEEFFYNQNGHMQYHEAGGLVGYVATVQNNSNKVPLEKDLVITLPTDSDDLLWYKASVNQTVTSFYCMLDPVLDVTDESLYINIYECNSSGTSCVSLLAGGTAINVLYTTGGTGTITDGGSALIDAGDWVKWELLTFTGSTVDALSCTLGGNY